MRPRLSFWGLALAGMLTAIQAHLAIAAVVVFDCKFPAVSFFVTVYDDGSPARVGIAQGVGDKAQGYFDKLTAAWIIVEFVADGALPSTLTTILKDGACNGGASLRRKLLYELGITNRNKNQYSSIASRSNQSDFSEFKP